MAARLLSCSDVTPIPLYSSILSIALEELNPSAGSQNQEDDLTSICAIYVAFSLQVKESGRRVMVSIGPWIIDITLEKQYLDSCLSKATKSFSVPDFSSMLKLVLDGLSHSSISKKHVSLLVDLSNNLIHHAPEGTLFVFALLTPSAHIWIGTLKLTQAHFTHCLGLFVNNAIYLEDIILRTRILRLIERQVNDRVRRYLLINLRLFSPFPSPPQFVLRIFRISGPYLVNCLRARASTRLTQIRTFIGTSFRFSTH